MSRITIQHNVRLSIPIEGSEFTINACGLSQPAAGACGEAWVGYFMLRYRGSTRHEKLHINSSQTSRYDHTRIYAYEP
jgi:hypothetical protein